MLADAGSVSRERALERANEQYDAFAERRRLEAESRAEVSYVEDLHSSAKALDSTEEAAIPEDSEDNDEAG